MRSDSNATSAPPPSLFLRAVNLYIAIIRVCTFVREDDTVGRRVANLLATDLAAYYASRRSSGVSRSQAIRSSLSLFLPEIHPFAVARLLRVRNVTLADQRPKPATPTDLIGLDLTSWTILASLVLVAAMFFAVPALLGNEPPSNEVVGRPTVTPYATTEFAAATEAFTATATATATAIGPDLAAQLEQIFPELGSALVVDYEPVARTITIQVDIADLEFEAAWYICRDVLRSDLVPVEHVVIFDNAQLFVECSAAN